LGVVAFPEHLEEGGHGFDSAFLVLGAALDDLVSSVHYAVAAL